MTKIKGLIFLVVALVLLTIVFDLVYNIENREEIVVETFSGGGFLNEYEAVYSTELSIGEVRSIEFTSDEDYMAVGILSANKLKVFKWNESLNCYEAMTAPLPTSGVGSVYGVDYSNDDNNLVLGHNTTPYITNYDVIDDDYDINNDNDLVVDNVVYDVKFYGDEGYLIVGGEFTNYLQSFKYINGDYIRISNNIDVLPSGSVTDIEYSNGYLFVASTVSPYSLVYKVEGEDLIKLDDPVSLPSNSAYSIDVNDKGLYAVYGIEDSPYIKIYKFEDEVMTDVSFDVIPTQTNITYAVKFIDNSMLYVGGDLGVYKYQFINDEFILQTNDVTTFTAPVYVMDVGKSLTRFPIGDSEGVNCYLGIGDISFNYIDLEYTPEEVYSVYQNGNEKEFEIIGDVLDVTGREYDKDVIVTYTHLVEEENFIVSIFPILAIIMVMSGILYVYKKR